MSDACAQHQGFLVNALDVCTAKVNELWFGSQAYTKIYCLRVLSQRHVHVMAKCCMTLHENSLTGLVKHIVCGFALHDNLLTGLAREFVEKRTGCSLQFALWIVLQLLAAWRHIQSVGLCGQCS